MSVVILSSGTTAFAYSLGSGAIPGIPYVVDCTCRILSNADLVTSHLCGGSFIFIRISPSKAPIYPSLFSEGILPIYFENSLDIPSIAVWVSSIVNLSNISKR